ncbi:MAG: putative AAA+ superfamily ATPase, partial [Bacteroidia bacterium]
MPSHHQNSKIANNLNHVNITLNVKFAWMFVRSLSKILKERLLETASVALLGPRQVGKTTLAFQLMKSMPSVYLDLENRTDLLKVQDLFTFHKENSDKLIILDEVQRLPEVFPTIRGIIDSERRKGNKTGHFLFLGSASIELLQQSSESLAGRISYLELFTINVLETLTGKSQTEKLNELWVRGGFPESLLSKTDRSSLQWRTDFIKTYIERDIPQ